MIPSPSPINSSDGLADPAAERSVESELQARREEITYGISRSIARVSAAVSITLILVWLLAQPYIQVLIYALLLLLLALSTGVYPLFQRRNQATAGLVLVNILSLIAVLVSPVLINSLMPVIGITDVIAITIAHLILGDRGSRWLVRAFTLAYSVDVVVVAILEWSPFPALERRTELWITGAVSLVGFLTAILIVRLVVVGLEQQFRRAQRLNVELKRQIQAVDEAQAAPRQERNLLHLLIDTVPATVYIKDRHSRFVEANLETALQMGAKTPNALLGKTDFDFYSGALAGKYYADEQAMIGLGLPLHDIEEASFDQRTQRNSWLLTTKVPILDERGVVTGLVGVSLDITEREHFQRPGLDGKRP